VKKSEKLPSLEGPDNDFPCEDQRFSVFQRSNGFGLRIEYYDGGISLYKLDRLVWQMHAWIFCRDYVFVTRLLVKFVERSWHLLNQS